MYMYMSKIVHKWLKHEWKKKITHVTDNKQLYTYEGTGYII